jgi:hypothetical protein
MAVRAIEVPVRGIHQNRVHDKQRRLLFGRPLASEKVGIGVAALTRHDRRFLVLDLGSGRRRIADLKTKHEHNEQQALPCPRSSLFALTHGSPFRG